MTPKTIRHPTWEFVPSILSLRCNYSSIVLSIGLEFPPTFDKRYMSLTTFIRIFLAKTPTFAKKSHGDLNMRAQELQLESMSTNCWRKESMALFDSRDMKNWVVVSNIFYFHPYLGKWCNLTNIFQMGWNHQLENIALFKNTLHMSGAEFLSSHPIAGLSKKRGQLVGLTTLAHLSET